MYTDNDLTEATASGLIAPDTAEAFRDFIATRRQMPRIDEEHYRILDGQNDTMVMMASILAIAGLANIAWQANHIVAGLVTAALACGLAEYFLRVRRLTLTGIILSLAFWVGVIATLGLALVAIEPDWGRKGLAAAAAVIAAISAGTGYLFWFRYRQPFSLSLVPLSASAGIVALAAIGLIDDQTLNPIVVLAPVLLICGIGAFAYAMWWDLSDPLRVTDRHETAFWLHGTAAALIVQPTFALLGVTAPTFYFVTTGQIVVTIIAYVVMLLVALVIDRRSLPLASVFVVMVTLAGMFVRFGAYNVALGSAALVLGVLLLLVSAFWSPLRAAIVPLLGGWTAKLPPVGRIERDTI